MVDLSLEELKQLLVNGRRAVQYACDHYFELVSRKAEHTLFGPYTIHIGAAMPGNSIPKRARELSLQTDKKNYLVYELDSQYRLLRTKTVFCSAQENTYHCFELDGIQYAYSFSFREKHKDSPETIEADTDEILAIGYKNGKPYYSGSLRKNSLNIEFYEHISEEKNLVTAYSYNPTSRYSQFGYPNNPEAKINTPNSSACSSCREQKVSYTFFSHWFQHPEAKQVNNNHNGSNKIDLCKEIAVWLDQILTQDIPLEVTAFCFNLYEDVGQKWSVELIGAAWFDEKNEDWACDEVTHFKTRQDPFSWEEEATWEDILSKISNALREYLKSGTYAEKLKSKSAVGVGFVDGNIQIVYP